MTETTALQIVIFGMNEANCSNGELLSVPALCYFHLGSLAQQNLTSFSGVPSNFISFINMTHAIIILLKTRSLEGLTTADLNVVI